MTELYGPEFFEGRSETVVASAQGTVPVLMELFNPLSVLDVGCGKGEWLEAFDVPRKYGVDIAAPLGLLFFTHDLREPFDLKQTYDLVLCVEVGEHLPEESSDTLVDTCVRHSRTVVFSSAVPGQGGAGHVNEQPHEYWHEKFNQRGYAMLDCIRPKLAGRFDVKPWYRNNMFAYVARGS